MKLMFIGAAHQVTGSCHYLEVCGKHILIDYGMEQGKIMFDSAPLPINEALIDCVLLTHAHVDHSGLLPLLTRNGFRGQIYATDATADLCNIMLRDCAHIQMQEAEWRSRKGKRNRSIDQVEPLYTMEDAENTIKRFVPVHYGDTVDIAPGIKIRFTDVGHLLGSSSIEVWMNENGIEKKICFSGDLGGPGHPLIRDPQFTDAADYVVMESTYGDRYHDTDHPDYVTELAAILNRTFKRGGNVVIPSFAVGRTQELLYFFREIKERGLVTELPDFDVYVDSPMAVSATEIFEDHVYDCFDDEALSLVNRGINPISFPGLRLSITSDESRAINDDPYPKVIISASGMCDAGRIKHHLKHNLWREESTVCFVGYQSIGTPGRTIKDGADEIKLFGEPVQINAEITKLRGMSGHADKNGLLNWINAFTAQKPSKVFVVHGDDKSAMSFVDCLKTEYGYDAAAPYSGTEFDLATGKFLVEGTPKVRVEKKAVIAVAGAFGRLRAAAERLLAVATKCEGMSNKDLGKFADQINSLADKWER